MKDKRETPRKLHKLTKETSNDGRLRTIGNHKRTDRLNKSMSKYKFI